MRFLVFGIRALGVLCSLATGQSALLLHAVSLPGLLVTLSLVALAAGSRADAKSAEDEAARLFTDCAPIHLDVEVTVKRLTEEDESNAFSLTKGQVQGAIEQQLDEKGIQILEDGESSVPGLFVKIGIAERAYSINMDFKKPLMDTRYSKQSLQATSWSTRTVGMHAWESDYLMDVVTSRADKFAMNYLEANETCSP